MAYRHITSCIPLGQQQSKLQRMVAYGIPAGIVGAVAGAIASGGLGAVAGFGGTIALAAVLGFCDWWFHYRLICLKDDQCAVGTVGRTAISTGITDPVVETHKMSGWEPAAALRHCSHSPQPPFGHTRAVANALAATERPDPGGPVNSHE